MNNESLDWKAIQLDSRFIELHQDKNRFLWRMMLFALIYFFLLPFATAYFQVFFKLKVWGVINIGLIFALSQFVVAWAIAVIYAKRANKEFDARAKALRNDAHSIKAKQGDQ